MGKFIIRKLINVKEKTINKKKKKVYTYEYFDSRKKRLNNNNNTKKMIEYSKQWRIPPAYPEVKVFLNVNDKKNNTCYAVGKDEKGRTQHLYTSYHSIISNKQKYCKVLEVGKNYDKIFNKLNKDLKSKRITKNKLIAILLKIMIECQFRPGHEKYKKEYGSIGLTTLQKKHIHIKNNKLIISFIGKKGVLNECELKDQNTVEELSKLIKNKKNNDDVFDYKKIKIKPTDINNYLPGKITAKNIRTWDANLEFINFSKKLDEPLDDKITIRKKQLKEVVEQVAHKLHHSAAICKKSYLDTDLFEMFVDKPAKFTKMFLKKNLPSHKLLIEYFQKKCK